MPKPTSDSRTAPIMAMVEGSETLSTGSTAVMAVHPHWLEFDRQAKDGYLLFGCMDRNPAFAIPLSLIDKHLADLNVTELSTAVKEGARYWHIQFGFDDQNRLCPNLSKVRKKIDLSPYAFDVSAGPT